MICVSIFPTDWFCKKNLKILYNMLSVNNRSAVNEPTKAVLWGDKRHLENISLDKGKFYVVVV